MNTLVLLRAVATVCRVFKELLLVKQQPMRAVLPLLSAVRKVQPTPNHLTPQHADFLQWFAPDGGLSFANHFHT